jgi:hypothetical protein
MLGTEFFCTGGGSPECRRQPLGASAEDRDPTIRSPVCI